VSQRLREVLDSLPIADEDALHYVMHKIVSVLDAGCTVHVTCVRVHCAVMRDLLVDR
jgi:hypothetical protein